MLKQKSRVQWLELGDGNNTFFHRSLMTRRNKNQIRRITLEDGAVIEEDRIREEAENYYKIFLAPNGLANHEAGNWQPDKKLTKDQKTMFCTEVKEEEIKEVIWNKKEGKSPGPDGFTLSFFKVAWEIVGNDVEDAIRYFFIFGKIKVGVNATFISLIPKKKKNRCTKS